MVSDWLYAKVTTDLSTGEETITYSHTPEEFVEEMKARGERWRVAKCACAGCFYTPERFVSEKDARTLDAEAMARHHTLECVRASIAQFKRNPASPGHVICYGFYYQHWHENQFLLAAKEAGLIDFYDVSDLPGPKEAGLKVHLPLVESLDY